MTFNEYVDEIKNVKGPRKHKATNSYTRNEIYRYYKSVGGKLSVNDFYSVIKATNLEFAELLCMGNDFILPNRLGSLELRKQDIIIKLDENGKLISNLPIDWNETHKLWYEYPECRNKKQIVRRNVKNIFSVHWSKRNSKCKNIKLFTFHLNRELKKKLKYNIENYNIDAFKLY